jgi:hypothetical protein
VWRANARSPLELWRHWAPAKPGPDVAALASLRPVALEVRVEAADGRSASRVFTRRLLAPSVKVRRWRDLSATLYLPEAPRATVITMPSLAAPLLASRGVLVVAATSLDALPALRGLLAKVPGGSEGEVVERLPLPRGVPAVAEALASDDEMHVWPRMGA